MLEAGVAVRVAQLRWCNVGDSGAAAPARATSPHRVAGQGRGGLTPFCAPGAEALGAQLATDFALEALSLAHNALTEEGAAHLWQALETNRVLREIDLSGNPHLSAASYAPSPAWSRASGVDRRCVCAAEGGALTPARDPGARPAPRTLHQNAQSLPRALRP